MLVLLGATCTAAGISLLHRSWSSRPRGSRMAIAAGWLLLVVAGGWWVALDGWEFGAIYAITVPSIAAGILLWLVADRRRRQAGRTAVRLLTRPGWSDVRPNLSTFLMVVPLGLTASTLVTSAVGLLLPFGELDQLVFIVCVMPIVWGFVAYWVLADERRRRPALSLAALSALSLLTILAL